MLDNLSDVPGVGCSTELELRGTQAGRLIDEPGSCQVEMSEEALPIEIADLRHLRPPTCKQAQSSQGEDSTHERRYSHQRSVACRSSARLEEPAAVGASAPACRILPSRPIIQTQTLVLPSGRIPADSGFT